MKVEKQKTNLEKKLKIGYKLKKKSTNKYVRLKLKL